MARPTKLTPDVQARICQAVQLGATYELAAQYGGVAYETLRSWLRAGEQRPNSPHAAFSAALKEAEGKGVLGWLAKIEKAASDGEWTAAAWKLERRYPQTYGRRVQEVTGRVEVVTDGVRDRLASRLDELAQRRRAKAAAG